MYEQALEFATKAHEGQFRRDGVTPYIEHPKRVAKMARSEKFQKWLRYEKARREGLLLDVEREVKKQMRPSNIKTEVNDSNGKWVEQTTTSTDNK